MKMRAFIGIIIMIICVFTCVAWADDTGYEEIDLSSELQVGDLTTLSMSAATDHFYVCDANEEKIISISSTGELTSVPSISAPEDDQYLSTLALTTDGTQPYVVALTVEEDEGDFEFTDAGLYGLDPARGIGELVCTLDLEDVMDENGDILNCTGSLMDDDTLFLLFSGRDSFTMDAQEGSVLLQFDLSTGEETLHDELDPDELIFMRDGAILYSRWNADTQQTDIVKYDYSADEEKTILSLPSDIQAPQNIVYDGHANQLFFTSANQFYGMKSPDSPAQLLALLPTRSIIGLAQISDTVFFAHDLKSVYRIEVDWDRRFEQQVLTVLGGDQTIYEYASLHPEIDLQEMDYLESEDLIRLMLTRSTTPDLICFSSDDLAFTSLKNRGYLQSIDSDAVRELVSRLHPDIRALVSVDGAPCAVPNYMLVQPMLGVNEALWARLELGDVPTSWPELIDFLEAWPDISRKYPEISLIPYTDWNENRTIFTYEFLKDYESYIGADPDLRYDSELFRSLASRLEAIPWERIEYPYEGDVNSCLFESEHDVSAQVETSIFKALPLSVEDGGDSYISANVSVVVLNPFSEQKELAEDCLEYIVETIDPLEKVMLRSEENSPVRDSDYMTWVEDYESQLDTLESEINAATDEALKQELTWEAEEIRRECDDYIQNGSWRATEQSISDYRDISKRIFIANANDWDQETRDAIDQYRVQYVNREMKLEQFISTMDRMRTMKIAESS